MTKRSQIVVAISLTVFAVFGWFFYKSKVNESVHQLEVSHKSHKLPQTLFENSNPDRLIKDAALKNNENQDQRLDEREGYSVEDPNLYESGSESGSVVDQINDIRRELNR